MPTRYHRPQVLCLSHQAARLQQARGAAARVGAGTAACFHSRSASRTSGSCNPLHVAGQPEQQCGGHAGQQGDETAAHAAATAAAQAASTACVADTCVQRAQQTHSTPSHPWWACRGCPAPDRPPPGPAACVQKFVQIEGIKKAGKGRRASAYTAPNPPRLGPETCPPKQTRQMGCQ